ncbi:hypothetical protein BV898_06633 [Hypsibius exemplaris]|uniref:Uncharacterized protein n=1 Tax=Hypsibius exemplaris TaxID=2072580 RepID=A0A1W0WW65_HYPEX|nr:hypothetical protein BV898_06633 [Hypsibius exemplaris]
MKDQRRDQVEFAARATFRSLSLFPGESSLELLYRLACRICVTDPPTSHTSRHLEDFPSPDLSLLSSRSANLNMDSKVMSLLLLVVFFVGAVMAVPYMEALTDSNDVDAYIPAVESAYDDQAAQGDRYLTYPQKRTCKRRGSRCQYWGEVL